MADAGISLQLSGDKVVIENFKILTKNSGNMRPAFVKIGDLMLKSFNLNFQSAGGRFGSRWASRKKSYPWPMLQKTGRMSRNFDSSTSSKDVVLGNRSNYFKYHQMGTRRMPARPMLGWSNTDLNDIVRILRAHIGI